MDKRRDELRDFLVNAAKDILNFFEEDFSCLSE
jgi:5-methylthioribose kinase